MNKEQASKLNLAEGYAFGTFQTFTKAASKKGNVYAKTGILIGKTVHEFLTMAPDGVTIDSFKAPAYPVGTVMAIKRPDFAIAGNRINSNCESFEPILG